MNVSKWSPKTLISLLSRNIVPENVWNAVSTHLDLPVLDTANWLKGVVGKANTISICSSFKEHLDVFDAVVSSKTEFEKKEVEILEALQKAMAPSGHHGPAQVEAYTKIKKSRDDALTTAQEHIERIEKRIRSLIVLHNNERAKARFSPKDGFLRVEWSNFQENRDAPVSNIVWETVIGPAGTPEPDKDMKDASKLPGYSSCAGEKWCGEYQSKDLIGTEEIVVWARIKYNHQSSAGKYVFFSTDWNMAERSILTDDTIGRYVAAYTITRSPTILRLGSLLRIDWTAALSRSPVNDSEWKREFRRYGDVVWDLTVSPTAALDSDPAAVRWKMSTLMYSSAVTLAQKTDDKFESFAMMHIRVRAIIDAGMPSYRQISAPGPVVLKARRPQGGHVLAPGEALALGEYLSRVSSDGSFEARLTVVKDPDCRVVLYHITPHRKWIAWQSEEGDLAFAAGVTMRENGNLDLIDGEDDVIWRCKFGTGAIPGSCLVLRDDGNATIVCGESPPIYREFLGVGEKLVSPNRKYELVLQGDGNLVIYAVGVGITWQNGHQHAGVGKIQEDDNFVYGTSTQTWSTNTRRRERGGRASLIIRDDGNAVLLSEGTIIWSSNPSLCQAYEPLDLKPVKPGSSMMRQGEFLGKGDSLVSNNGVWKLTVQPSGNLVLGLADSKENVIWTSNTASTTVTRLCFGKYPPYLALFEQGAKKIWDPAARKGLLTHQKNGEFVLFLGDDGNLALRYENQDLHDYSWRTERPWSSNTRFPTARTTTNILRKDESMMQNHRLVSKNGAYELSFTRDGRILITATSTKNIIFAQRCYTPSKETEIAQMLSVIREGLQLCDTKSNRRWHDGLTRHIPEIESLVLTDEGHAYLSGHAENPEPIRWVLYPQEKTHLESGSSLWSNQRLVSPNGKYTFSFQGDGNLVLYQRTPSIKARWHSNTADRDVERLTLEEDGNLVLRTRWSTEWQTRTGGRLKAARVLKLTDGGEIALLEGGVLIWESSFNAPPL
ncbi:hypothetical protein ONZ43_g2058 [Nemania bipapillata]|uniref:Uncharacterized protein n=1 Tax=Nemania bipapillata TaxID=110536 RepID=A0ACC2J218_9PEZI|nr:hypothetical protein ONZ43_g2058 [Nemania bipapillata]